MFPVSELVRVLVAHGSDHPLYQGEERVAADNDEHEEKEDGPELREAELGHYRGIHHKRQSRVVLQRLHHCRALQCNHKRVLFGFIRETTYYIE